MAKRVFLLKLLCIKISRFSPVHVIYLIYLRSSLSSREDLRFASCFCLFRHLKANQHHEHARSVARRNYQCRPVLVFPLWEFVTRIVNRVVS